jgi:cytochrome c556
MPRFVLHALIVASAAALGACATQDRLPDNPQAVVNQRVGIMKSFVAALGTANAFTQGKATADAAKAKVAVARTGAGQLADLFPRGTALGDRGITDSRALSTIFANRSDFDSKRAALVDAFAVLDGALAKNAKADATKYVTQTKNACLSCHSRYRTPDEK